RNVARRITQGRLQVPREPAENVRELIRGRSRDQPVIIVGVSLGLHQRLPSSIRAAREVRLLWRAAIKRVDYRFGLLGHLVDRAMPVIDNLLGMPKRPTRVRSRVTGVGRSGSVIARDRARE